MNFFILKCKLIFTCSNCSKIFKNPVELPCEHIICEEHLMENSTIKQNKIICNECKQGFEVEGKHFKSIKYLKQQLEDQICFSDEEVDLKKKIEYSIKLFLQMYEQFTLSKNCLDLDCHNHFQELRRQLDIHRETLKETVDEIYFDMIEKTKEFEDSFLKSLNEKLEAFCKSIEVKSIEDELKDIEDKFRNPYLLIEPIKVMHLKQQETIEKIQSTLNEMNQIKIDLKTSNKFIRNLSFDKDSFGELYLNGYPFEDSSILKYEQPIDLIKLCEFSPNQKWEVLYRATRDGFDEDCFHSKCDEHANTLSIFKVKGNEFIFGAFTTATWDSSSGYKSDSDAFLFSLTNKDNEPCKMKIDASKHHKAIYCDSFRGPSFGINDIDIIFIANRIIGSFSFYSQTYKNPQYDFLVGTNEAESFLAGSKTFHLSEIEVYQKV